MSDTPPTLPEPPRRGGLGWVALLPLVIFLGLAAIFWNQLTGGGNPQDLPSALIGSPAPEFELPPIERLVEAGAPVPGFSRADLMGRVSLVNVFASWCGPCREEHPLLMQLAEDGRFAILGLNYKDAPENATRFLYGLGNPYDAVGSDRNGRVGIDWGVYGVPETFVVAADGTIVYKHVGPLSEASLRDKLMPEVEKALAAAPSS